MKVCTCFVLFTTLAHTKLISGITQKGDLRSVYLIQDKVPEFSNKKHNGDTKPSHSETKFITERNRIYKQYFRSQMTKTFTGFVVEAIKILNTYGDTAFEDFFHTLDGEIATYQYRREKFSELMKNDDSRKFVSSTFYMIQKQPISVTRKKMNAMAHSLRDETYDDNVKTLLDYINTLYSHAEDKFQNVLVDLKHYKNSKSIRTHIKLQKLIRYAVRTILFDHYSELNRETRQELKEKIQTFWESKKKSSAEMRNIPAVSKTGMNNMNIVEKFMNAYVGTEGLSKKTDEHERVSSEEASKERSQDNTVPKTEKGDASSDESVQQLINYTSSELLTGESFDISSNSIKKSQERHELFNTQRYMTLYTEELTFKTTTKKTKIVLRAANATTTTNSGQKRPTTTSMHSSKDISVKIVPEKTERLKANHGTERRPTTTSRMNNRSIDTSVKMMPDKKEKLRTNFDTERRPLTPSTSKHSSKDISVKIVAEKIERVVTNPKMEKQPNTTSTAKHRSEDLSIKIKPEEMEQLRMNLDMESGTVQDMSSDSNDDSHSGLSLESNQPMVKQYLNKPQIPGKLNVVARPEDKDKNAGLFIQDDADRQSKSVPIKITIHPKIKQRQEKTRFQTRTRRKTPSKYFKPYESNDGAQIDFRKSITVSHLPNEEQSKGKLITDKLKYPIRRTANDSNIEGSVFTDYVIKRLDAIEKELKELKQSKDKLRKETDKNKKEEEFEPIKETNKDKKDVLVQLVQENHNEQVNLRRPFQLDPLNAGNKRDLNTTATKNTLKNNITITDKETTANDLTTVTVTELTTGAETVAATAEAVATSDEPESKEQSYYQQQRIDHMGFFEHINEELDLGAM